MVKKSQVQMNPYFSQDGIEIYQGDCVELLNNLNASINLTITSPPYNIGKEYEEIYNTETYIKWCTEWIDLIFHLSSKDSSFWLNLGYLNIPHIGKAVPIPYLLWNKTNFYLLQEIIWNYGAGVATKNTFSPRNEKFLWYVKDPTKYIFNLDKVRDKNVKYPNQKKNGKLKCNPLGKNPTDVWQFPKVTSGKNRSSKERSPHPAQFPEAVIERIILACSNKGDLVLDPFLGSGTTAAVCKRLGRRCIGIEIRKDYLDFACQRISSILPLV